MNSLKDLGWLNPDPINVWIEKDFIIAVDASLFKHQNK